MRMAHPCLEELVHRLQVVDIGGDLILHLAQHYAAPGAGTSPHHHLEVVAHNKDVGTPAAMLDQPFLHH